MKPPNTFTLAMSTPCRLAFYTVTRPSSPPFSRRTDVITDISAPLLPSFWKAYRPPKFSRFRSPSSSSSWFSTEDNVGHSFYLFISIPVTKRPTNIPFIGQTPNLSSMKTIEDNDKTFLNRQSKNFEEKPSVKQKAKKHNIRQKRNDMTVLTSPLRNAVLKAFMSSKNGENKNDTLDKANVGNSKIKIRPKEGFWKDIVKEKSTTKATKCDYIICHKFYVYF